MKRWLLKAFLASVFPLCLCVSSVAGGLLLATGARADRVDDYVKTEMSKRQIPGVSLAVVQDGKVVKAKGYGLANVELDVPATENTVYELASVTKQFTATAIMMLVEEGKLSLDDKVTKILSELPTAWEGVTVRHLLNHTSGILSYTSTPGFDKTMRKDFTHDEIIQLVSKAPMEFAPGAKWNYNNTGFFLLGMIIEKVSGKPYGDFLAERIFKPLGMSTTRVNDFHEIIKNRAMGYSRQGGTIRNCEYVSPTQPFAAGALVSTVLDLTKWDAALTTEKLLKKSVLEQMWTPTKLNDGKTADYGFGWSVQKANGHREISHGGGIPGFSTYIARYVDDKLTVIVLTNLDGGDAGRLAQGVAGQYVPALAPKTEKPIEDKDPKTTQRLKDLLLAAAEGKADPDQFTPEMRAAIFPDKVKEGAELLKSLGPLKSLELMEQSSQDKLRRYRYRVNYEKGAIGVTLVLNEENKISGLGLRPE